jgi:flagellar protein FliO/FliZ
MYVVHSQRPVSVPALVAKLHAAATLWLGCIASALAAVEAPAHKFAQPAASSAPVAPAAGLAQVTLALALVLAAIFAAAWAVRRFRLLSGGRTESDARITVLAERAVGPRERVVLLQVGGEQVLVGVATGNVRRLHVMHDGGASAVRNEART